MTWLLSLSMACLGFLSGSVMYAYVLPKRLYGADVRNYGDGNPGAFNVHLCTNLRLTVTCVLLDILKGLIPVMVSYRLLHLTGWLLVLPGLAPVLGHIFPPMLKGQGGKAICTVFGVFIALLPCLIAPLWAGIILLLLPFIRDHRVLILTSAVILIPFTFVFVTDSALRFLCVCLALLVMARHLPFRQEARP